MTLSILIYALMVASLLALAGALVVDAVRGDSRERSDRHVAGPGPRPGRSRHVRREDYRRPLRPAASTAARMRRGGTPRSCRR
jgi:hypothetical protein